MNWKVASSISCFGFDRMIPSNWCHTRPKSYVKMYSISIFWLPEEQWFLSGLLPSPPPVCRGCCCRCRRRRCCQRRMRPRFAAEKLNPEPIQPTIKKNISGLFRRRNRNRKKVVEPSKDRKPKKQRQKKIVQKDFFKAMKVFFERVGWTFSWSKVFNVEFLLQRKNKWMNEKLPKKIFWFSNCGSSY